MLLRRCLLLLGTAAQLRLLLQVSKRRLLLTSQSRTTRARLLGTATERRLSLKVVERRLLLQLRATQMLLRLLRQGSN